MFEHRVLRKLFGHKRQNVTWDYRKLHNEELHDLYSSADIIRETKSRASKTGCMARMGDRKGAWRVLLGISEGRRLLGRPRRRKEIILNRVLVVLTVVVQVERDSMTAPIDTYIITVPLYLLAGL